MSCYFSAWLLIMVMLLPSALSAQVPAIADIPDGLPEQLRLQLTQTRASLAQRRDQIKVRVAEQKDQCGAVPEGSPQEQTCRVSKTELLTAINQYAADVRQFTDDVAAAIAPAKSQPVSNPTSTQAGAAAAVRGNVYWLTKDGKKVPIKAGSPMFLNQHIVTGPNSRLQVLLPDDTTFTVGPGGDMVLDDFVYDPTTSVRRFAANIIKGTFRLVTGKLTTKQSDDIKLRLPIIAVGIRGTDVEISYTHAQEGYIKLFAGRADIIDTTTGVVLELNANQMLTLNADGTIGRPVSLKDSFR